jgi:hypothetical protein
MAQRARGLVERHVSDFCPTCGRLRPDPVHEEIVVREQRERCEDCGTQLGEIHRSVQANAVTCLRYLRGVERVLSRGVALEGEAA